MHYKLVDEKPKAFVLVFETTMNWHRAKSLCYEIGAGMIPIAR